MFILVSINAQHIAKYIASRERDDFKFRTQKNTLCALKWHITFLKYLTHPDVVTTGWAPTDLLLRHIATPKLKSQVETLARHLSDSHSYIKNQISQLVKPAEQQVKARNSQEALQAKGKWITMEWMGKMAEVLDKEGWARIERLQAVLPTTTIDKLVSVCSTHLIAPCDFHFSPLL
jgi:predicted transcriptional regulator